MSDSDPSDTGTEFGLGADWADRTQSQPPRPCNHFNHSGFDSALNVGGTRGAAKRVAFLGTVGLARKRRLIAERSTVVVCIRWLSASLLSVSQFNHSASVAGVLVLRNDSRFA